MTIAVQVVSRRLIFTFLLLISIQGNVWSQTENHKAVQTAIETMFDGMREGDSTKVSGVFAKHVQMFSASVQEDGQTRLTEGSSTRFLTAVGTPHDQVWDERISNLNIQIDGPLATAWMDYSFYLDGVFSHCGVNAMTLVWMDDTWKIIYLIDTRRKKDCE